MNVRLKEIPLAAIDIGENVRTIRDAKQDAALASSIRENGVLQPVCVAGIPGTDCYQLVYGSRRLGILRESGQKTVIAQVLDDPHTPSSDERTIRQIAENSARVPLHPSDLLAAVGGLVGCGWTGARIAKRLGEKESTVCRWIAVAQNATPDMLARLRAGTLSLSAAYELCKAPPESRRAVLADAPASVHLTREMLVDRIKRVRRKERAGNAAVPLRRITANFDRARSIIITGRDLTIDVLINCFGTLLARATSAQAQGLDLRNFAESLKLPPTAPGSAAA